MTSQRGETGQATVELALLLPVLALFGLLLIQIGLVVRAQVMLTHGAREAARVVAVTNDPDLARTAAASAAGVDPAAVSVAVSGETTPGGDFVVSVRSTFLTDVPLIGALVGDVSLSAAATMRAEG